MAVVLHYAHFSALCKLVLIVHIVIYDLFSYRKLQHNPFPQQRFLCIWPDYKYLRIVSELVGEFIVEENSDGSSSSFVTRIILFGCSVRFNYSDAIWKRPVCVFIVRCEISCKPWIFQVLYTFECRQLTPNFEFWVEFFACRHVSIWVFQNPVRQSACTPIRESATQNRLIFQLCFIMPKIKLYVCRILCENFIQIGQKMKKL